MDIILAGPNTAALDLESCFLSPLQGATARRYIEISEICYNALAPFLEEIHTRSATKHGPQRVCIEDLRNSSQCRVTTSSSSSGVCVALFNRENTVISRCGNMPAD